MSGASACITVREATEGDHPAIARIQQLCPEAAQWPLGDYSAFPVLFAWLNSTPAGFCAWRQVTSDEAELLNLAVDPALRGKGVASALLTALADLAAGKIFLEVAESNEPALALYRKFGFDPIGIRSGYYSGGVNAVVMKNRSW